MSTTRRYETDSTSGGKWWQIEIWEHSHTVFRVTTTWGRLGQQGQSRDKDFNSMVNARSYYLSKCDEKERKGYKLVQRTQRSVKPAYDMNDDVGSRLSDVEGTFPDAEVEGFSIDFDDIEEPVLPAPGGAFVTSFDVPVNTRPFVEEVVQYARAHGIASMSIEYMSSSGFYVVKMMGGGESYDFGVSDRSLVIKAGSGSVGETLVKEFKAHIDAACAEMTRSKLQTA